MSAADDDEVVVRSTRREDFDAIIALSRRIYSGPAWKEESLASHLRVFPEGQLVAVSRKTGDLLGMAASLIIDWDDYEVDEAWTDYTASGMFTNHDPVNGRTLYGAEVMVAPEHQRLGIGSKLYEARREMARRLRLVRIRAHARLAGYHRHADAMSPKDYVRAVVRGELRDPTLSFQLARGFHVLAVNSGYLVSDPESRGHAALIEWINEEVARPEDTARRKRDYDPA
jgi:GNAT superfamily N-acetyltransferase